MVGSQIENFPPCIFKIKRKYISTAFVQSIKGVNTMIWKKNNWKVSEHLHNLDEPFFPLCD